MNVKKIFISGLAGGIVAFLLGWLFYGMLFTDFFSKHAGTATGVNRSETEMIFWALILGHIALGFLLAYVIDRGAEPNLQSGLTAGFIVGVLFSSGINLIMYATTHLYGLISVAADVAITGVICAVSGAVIGLICSKMKS